MTTLQQIWEVVGWIIYAGIFGGIGYAIGVRVGYTDGIAHVRKWADK